MPRPYRSESPNRWHGLYDCAAGRWSMPTKAVDESVWPILLGGARRCLKGSRQEMELGYSDRSRDEGGLGLDKQLEVAASPRASPFSPPRSHLARTPSRPTDRLTP